MIVEVGIKLNKDLKYYDNMLKQYGFKNDFTVDTYDIYYTNKNFDGMSENEIKNSCINLYMRIPIMLLKLKNMNLVDFYILKAVRFDLVALLSYEHQYQQHYNINTSII